MNKFLGLFLLFLGIAIGYFVKEAEINSIKNPTQVNNLEDRPIKYQQQFDIEGDRTTKYHKQLQELGLASFESNGDKMNELTYNLMNEGINPKRIRHVPINTPTESGYKEQLKGIDLKNKKTCAIIEYTQNDKAKFYVACK